MRSRKRILIAGCLVSVLTCGFWVYGAQKKGKPTGTGQIALNFTFDDANGDRIQSDGGGEYLDSSEGVSAHVGDDGRLILNPEPVHGAAARYFVFNFTDGYIDGTGDPRVTCDPDLNVSLDDNGMCDIRDLDFEGSADAFDHFFGAGTVVAFNPVNMTDEGLDCGGNPTPTVFTDMVEGNCLRGRANFQINWTNRKVPSQLFLRSGRYDSRIGTVADQTGTDDIQVVCDHDTDGKCDKWLLSPCVPQEDSPSCGNGSTLRMRLYENMGKGDGFRSVADFDMPFGMTITRVP